MSFFCFLDGTISSGRCESVSQAVCVILAQSKGKTVSVFSDRIRPRGCYTRTSDGSMYYNKHEVGAACTKARRCFCGRDSESIFFQ